MFVRHPYLLLEVPNTFTATAAAERELCAFRDEGEDVTLRIAIDPPSLLIPGFRDETVRLLSSEGSIRSALERVLRTYLAQSAQRLLNPPDWRVDGHVTSVTLTLRDPATGRVEYGRFAASSEPLPSSTRLEKNEPTSGEAAASPSDAHPIVWLRIDAPKGIGGDALTRIFDRAVLAPHAVSHVTNARMQDTALQYLYPYVVTRTYIAQRDALFARSGLTPERDLGLPRLVADELFLALAQDRGDGLRILFPSDVARDSLDWDRCVDHAKRNLLAKVGTCELPLAVHPMPSLTDLGPGCAPWRGQAVGRDEVSGERLLVLGESWLAASCIATPELRIGAAAQLGADQLMAIAPNRDRLFVFADLGERRNAELSQAIRLVERDAPQALTPTLFRLGEAAPVDAH